MNEDLIKEYISNNFPDEVEILGGIQIEKIIQAKSIDKELQIFSSDKGRNIEFVSLITVIGVAVQVVDFSMRVIKEKKNTISAKQKIKEEIETFTLKELTKAKQKDLSLEPYELLIEDLLKDV